MHLSFPFCVGSLYEGTAKLKTKADIRKAEKGESSVNKGFKADFDSGMIAACYVVFGGEAVVVNASVQTRQEIMSAIEQLNPGAPTY